MVLVLALYLLCRGGFSSLRAAGADGLTDREREGERERAREGERDHETVDRQDIYR